MRTKSGTCRDYAWLMIEALRRLGFASRFVSGYLYDPALDGGTAGTVGSGATHAWVQVFLPGAGWVHYDPTRRKFPQAITLSRSRLRAIPPKRFR